jgi:hypothetical protein
MKPRLFGILAILCAVLAVVVAAPLSAFAGQPQHGDFDDSRYPHTFGSHGDPTTGVPSSATGNSGYYYLNVSVGSNGTVHAAIWTSSGRWRIDIDNGFDKHPLRQYIGPTPVDDISVSGLRQNQFIRVRFANLSGTTRPDHGSAYSRDACAILGGAGETSRQPATARCGPDPNSGGSTSSPPGGSTGGTAQPNPVAQQPAAPAKQVQPPAPSSSGPGKPKGCDAN